MAGKFLERFPHPLQLGIDIFNKKPRAMSSKEQRSILRNSVGENQRLAKERIAAITAAHPEIVIKRSELERYRPEDESSLYKRPANSLMHHSPHQPRHFFSDLVMSSFLGNYANATFANASFGRPLDTQALQFSAITHDGFRRKWDIAETFLDFQRHGRKAAEHVEDSLSRMGMRSQLNPTTLHLVREINQYHDVDHRKLWEKSPELELFTLVDKMELVRLLRPDKGEYNKIAELIFTVGKFASRDRMNAYDGSEKKIMQFLGEFLPVADALYTLSMQNVQQQFHMNGGERSRINQFEAVMQAAEQLGLVVDDRIPAEERKQTSRGDTKHYRGLKSYWYIARRGIADKRIYELTTFARPENRKQTKRSAKRMVESLKPSITNGITETTYRRYKPTRNLFLNPFTQVLDSSSHNILHAGATQVLAGSISSSVVSKERPNALNRQAILLASGLHDSQRLSNIPETVLARQAHAKRAAKKTPELLKKMGLHVDLPTESLVGGLMKYHDMVTTSHDTDPNLQILQLADNLGMVRFLLKQSRIPLVGRRINTMVDRVQQQAVLDKLLDFAPLNPEVAALKMPYITIAMALYTLAEEKAKLLKKATPRGLRRQRDYQFEAVLEAAKELGLIQ